VENGYGDLSKFTENMGHLWFKVQNLSITISIRNNNHCIVYLWNVEKLLAVGLGEFASEHRPQLENTHLRSYVKTHSV